MRACPRSQRPCCLLPPCCCLSPTPAADATTAHQLHLAVADATVPGQKRIRLPTYVDLGQLGGPSPCSEKAWLLDSIDQPTPGTPVKREVEGSIPLKSEGTCPASGSKACEEGRVVADAAAAPTAAAAAAARRRRLAAVGPRVGLGAKCQPITFIYFTAID